MGCSSSSHSVEKETSSPSDVTDVDSIILESDTTEDAIHRTIQLTAHKAKQEAKSMISDPEFRNRPQGEQLALQREFIAHMQGMVGSEARSAAIAKAMLQQLLQDKLFLDLLGHQPLDLKEEVQIAASPKSVSGWNADMHLTVGCGE